MLTGIRKVLGMTAPIDTEQLGGPAKMPGYYQAPSVNDIVKGWSRNPLKWEADLNRVINVNLPKYLASEQTGETELYTYLSNTYLDCQPTGHEPMVVLAGYSQGAMVVHNVLNLLALGGKAGVATIIKGAVLVADPERTTFSNVPNFGTATASDEGICPWFEGSAIGKLDAFSCVGSDRTADVAEQFAKSTIAVCDEKDFICDWSADVHSNATTDFEDIKYGKRVHTNCYTYCGGEVITAGKWIGRKLIADGLGTAPSLSPSPTATPTSTGTGGGSWTALTAPTPGGATSGTLESVTCPSTTCVAMGWDSKGILIVSGSGSSWTATDTPGPVSTEAGASIDPWGGPYVACATPSACTAVGYYDNNTGGGSTYGYLVTEGVGASWTVRKPPLPANALADGDVELKSVACPSPTQCVAVGVYTDSSYNTQGLVLTGSGSSWQATEAPVPADAVTSSGAQLLSVACSSPSQCVIGGSYDVAGSGGSSAYEAGLILTGWGSSWTASPAPVPANADPNTNNIGDLSYVDQVACPASGCVATGEYVVSSSNEQGMLLTQSGTSWTAVETPRSGVAEGSEFLGLGCAPGAACTAWGIYDVAAAQPRVVVVTGSGSLWKATDIANAASWVGGGAQPDVACLSATVCTALDPYDATPGLLITGSGTTWTTTTAPLPSDAQSTGARLSAIACSSAQCVSVGSYYNSADDQEGLLDIEPGR